MTWSRTVGGKSKSAQEPAQKRRTTVRNIPPRQCLWTQKAKIKEECRAAGKETMKDDVAGEHLEMPGFKLRSHQRKTVDHLLRKRASYDASDPGTGKTLAHLMAVYQRKQAGERRPVLVLAPKSILQVAWGDDIDKFFGADLKYSVAYAENRERAFACEADIYITNYAAVTPFLMEKGKAFMERFGEIIVDEATAFKTPTTQRTKALTELGRFVERRRCLSGTCMPKSVLDMWSQAFFLDYGERLGDSYYRFRSQVCERNENDHTGFNPWIEKEDAVAQTTQALRDIFIRYRLEDVLEIPENYRYTLSFDLPPKHMAYYRKMEEEHCLELKDGFVEGVNAAVLANKLLQIASGSVYDSSGSAKVLDDGRAELVVDLIKERKHPCLVFFNWTHQLGMLRKRLEKEGISYGEIHGAVNDRRRVGVVRDIQGGRLRAAVLHPEAAAHGLTLTAAKTVIFMSPVYKPDILKQGIGRIYRTGQTDRTETIFIAAKGTRDYVAYQVMDGKRMRMEEFLRSVTNEV